MNPETNTDETSAQETLLAQIARSAAEGHVDTALDQLFLFVDDRLLEDRFGDVDDLLARTDTATLHGSLLVGGAHHHGRSPPRAPGAYGLRSAGAGSARGRNHRPPRTRRHPLGTGVTMLRIRNSRLEKAMERSGLNEAELQARLTAAMDSGDPAQIETFRELIGGALDAQPTVRFDGEIFETDLRAALAHHGPLSQELYMLVLNRLEGLGIVTRGER